MTTGLIFLSARRRRWRFVRASVAVVVVALLVAVALLLIGARGDAGAVFDGARDTGLAGVTEHAVAFSYAVAD